MWSTRSETSQAGMARAEAINDLLGGGGEKASQKYLKF
jgi:hypothetical protein